MNTYSRASLLAGVEFKRVRVIRTQEGARRYGKPIGSIIGGNGEHHEHLTMGPGVFKGFETVTGKDGQKYDVGFDEDTNKWVATLHNSWHDVTAGGSEDEVYRNLNNHVGGKIAPKKKVPAPKPPKKAVAKVPQPAAEPAKPTVPTPAKGKTSTRKLAPRQAAAQKLNDQLREAGSDNRPVGEMSHDELVAEARSIATHLAGKPKGRSIGVARRLRDLNHELNYRKRISQTPKGGTSTGDKPYEVISKNSKAKTAKLRYKDHVYAVQRRGGGLPGWDITDEHGNVTRSHDGISSVRGATSGAKESEAALRSGLENAHSTRTVRQEVLSPDALAAADAAKARLQVQKDVRSGRLKKTKPKDLRVGDVVKHGTSGESRTVGFVANGRDQYQTGHAHFSAGMYHIIDTEGRTINQLSPNATTLVDTAAGSQKVNTRDVMDKYEMRARLRAKVRNGHRKLGERLAALQDQGLLNEVEYNQRSSNLDELESSDMKNIGTAMPGDLKSVDEGNRWTHVAYGKKLDHDFPEGMKQTRYTKFSTGEHEDPKFKRTMYAVFGHTTGDQKEAIRGYFEPEKAREHRDRLVQENTPQRSQYDKIVAGERAQRSRTRKQSQTLGDSPRNIRDMDRYTNLTEGRARLDPLAVRNRAQAHHDIGKTPAAAWNAALTDFEQVGRGFSMKPVTKPDTTPAPPLTGAERARHREYGKVLRGERRNPSAGDTKLTTGSLKEQAHNGVEFLRRMQSSTGTNPSSQAYLDNAANIRRMANHYGRGDAVLGENLHKIASRYENRKITDKEASILIQNEVHKSRKRHGEKSLQFKAPVITPGGRVGDDAKLGSRANGTNWVERSAPGDTGSLPAYIRIVRNALIKHGKDESTATAIAVATVKKWATGGGNVSAKVHAAAAKAVAQWEAMKVKNKVKEVAKKS